MKNDLLHLLKSKTKYWWTSLIVGIISIALGIWCFANPGDTLVALTLMFIIGFFASGILDIAFAISSSKFYSGWGWTLAGGIVDILFGVLLAFIPIEVSAQVLIYFIGFWLMFRSLWTIGISIEINRFVSVTGLLLIGVLSFLFSIFYLFSSIFFPVGNIILIATIAGFAFISYGLFRIIYAFEIKKINKKIDERLNK